MSGAAATGSGDRTAPLPRGRPEWRVEASPVPYGAALAAMEARVAAIRAGAAPELVWLLEHPPTYTAGTSARPDGLVEARFPTVRAGRGGQWTYHGPGQRVAYVMLDLDRRGRDVRAHVRGLEAWAIGALARLGVAAESGGAGREGVWARDPAAGGALAKVGALGVRVTRWVTWHGLALNVAPEMDHYAGIVPCGIADAGVTSLRRLGLDATMARVDAALAEAWAEAFGD